MLYITALSTIALLAVFGKVMIQAALQQQSGDALVINIAGRQRMLSQRLTKAALALAVFTDTQDRQQNANELQAVAVLWQHSQQGLQHGDAALGLPGHNSLAVQHLFAKLNPHIKPCCAHPTHCSLLSKQEVPIHVWHLLLPCYLRSV